MVYSLDCGGFKENKLYAAYLNLNKVGRYYRVAEPKLTGSCVSEMTFCTLRL